MISVWLAPGGVFYVEVPNIESYCRTKSVGNMFHYGHIWNFNPWTLRTAAGLAGLVEVPETTVRSQNTTGVFFREGPVLDPIHASNTENGESVLAIIRQHYDGAFRKGRAKKPFAQIAARVEETLTGFMAGSPRDIGSKLAQRL